MLVLGRRIGEAFTILPDGIQIGVVGVHNGIVRIGIIASKDRPILRNELMTDPAGDSKNPAAFITRQGDVE